MPRLLITHEREKLLNALIYFSGNVRFPGKTKLFKLLNFLDFLHYEKTGRSVTGLKYNAWKWGPVPEELNNEWDRPEKDFNQHLHKRMEKYGNGKQMQKLIPNKEFDSSWFSPFELDIMEMLSKRHFNHTANEMSEMSHFETGPWHETWEVNGEKQAEIPYDLVLLRRGNAEDLEVMETAKEYGEFELNYK